MDDLLSYIWKDSDDEILIEMIRENPILWDTKRTDYRDSTKKQRIIMQLSNIFPGTTPMEIEKRFIALKEKYRREKKKIEKNTRSGSGAVSQKVWHLMPKLDFLGCTLKSRNTSSSNLHTGSSYMESEINTTYSDNYDFVDNTPEILITSTPQPASQTLSPATSIFNTLPTESQIPKCPTTAKQGNRLRNDLFRESSEVLRKISKAVTDEETQTQELEDHLKIFDYMGRQTFRLPSNERNRVVRDLMEVFWDRMCKKLN